MKRVTTLALLAVLTLLGPVALAQSGDGYDLTWNTTDGGGYTFSSAEGYSLGGTIGQPDAQRLTGDDYVLDGGFWGSGPVPYEIYLPLILRNP